MAKITIFQRYSSVENTVTNNTLQLFARIYKHSPEQASRILAEITDQEIEIGLEIQQQVRIGNAIPDGALSQSSFKILVEAKVDSPIDGDQLLRHCLGFSDESQQILLLLTKQKISVRDLNALSKRIAHQSPKVIFRNITYEGICEACQGMFMAHEFDMLALIEDYAEYCNDAQLFDQSAYLMRVVPCSVSLDLNEKYSMYFDLSSHGYTKHRFVGIYAKKSVHFLILLCYVMFERVRVVLLCSKSY